MNDGSVCFYHWGGNQMRLCFLDADSSPESAYRKQQGTHS